MKRIIIMILFLEMLLNTTYSISIKNPSDTCNEFHRIGINYFYQNEYGKAIEYLEDAIKLDSSCDDSYYLKGLIYIDEESGYFDLFKAGREFEKAISIRPNNAIYYYELSRCYLIAGNEEGYFRNVHKALDIEPTDWLIFYGHAGNCYYLEMPDSVIYYCSKIITNPNVGNAMKIMGYLRRAKCYLFLLPQILQKENLDNNEKQLKLLHNYKIAQNDLNKVFEVNANEPEALFYQGVIFYNLGSYQNAKDDCYEALNYIAKHPSYNYLIKDIQSLIKLSEEQLK